MGTSDWSNFIDDECLLKYRKYFGRRMTLLVELSGDRLNAKKPSPIGSLGLGIDN
jgi:hypothetical protein